jgi:hypothetical protein
MSKVQCRNCDEFGHTGRECLKPTDWSRVECSNCHEKGHSYKRCKQPAAVDSGNEGDGMADGGGWGTTADDSKSGASGWGADEQATNGGKGGGWDDSAAPGSW